MATARFDELGLLIVVGLPVEELAGALVKGFVGRFVGGFVGWFVGWFVVGYVEGLELTPNKLIKETVPSTTLVTHTFPLWSMAMPKGPLPTVNVPNVLPVLLSLMTALST